MVWMLMPDTVAVTAWYVRALLPAPRRQNALPVTLEEKSAGVRSGAWRSGTRPLDAPRRLFHAARPGLRPPGLKDPVDVLAAMRGRKRRERRRRLGIVVQLDLQVVGDGDLLARSAPSPAVSVHMTPLVSRQAARISLP